MRRILKKSTALLTAIVFPTVFTIAQSTDEIMVDVGTISTLRWLTIILGMMVIALLLIALRIVKVYEHGQR